MVKSAVCAPGDERNGVFDFGAFLDRFYEETFDSALVSMLH